MLLPRFTAGPSSGPPGRYREPGARPWVMVPFRWDRQGHAWAVVLILTPRTDTGIWVLEKGEDRH